MPVVRRSKAERRHCLSRHVESQSHLAMPACSACQRARAVCRVSNLHSSCSRCLERGSRCDATLDDEECAFCPRLHCPVLTVVVNRVICCLDQARRRKKEAKRQLEQAKKDIREYEEKARVMLGREGNLLDAFDEAERTGGGASMEVPLADGLIAEFTGVDEGNWDAFIGAAAECGFPSLDGTAEVDPGNSTNV